LVAKDVRSVRKPEADPGRMWQILVGVNHK